MLCLHLHSNLDHVNSYRGHIPIHKNSNQGRKIMNIENHLLASVFFEKTYGMSPCPSPPYFANEPTCGNLCVHIVGLIGWLIAGLLSHNFPQCIGTLTGSERFNGMVDRGNLKLVVCLQSPNIFGLHRNLGDWLRIPSINDH